MFILTARFFRDRLLVIDVSSHSFGLETAGGVMTVLLPRNSSIPDRKRQTFSTYSDNQKNITFTIYEGENSMTRDNRKLGTFQIYDIPMLPRGKPQIEVSFDLDVFGILRINGEDRNTGKLYRILTRADKDLLTRAEIDERKLRLANMDLSEGILHERAMDLLRLEQCAFAMKQLAIDLALEESVCAIENARSNGTMGIRSELDKISSDVLDWLGTTPILGSGADPSIQRPNEMSDTLALEESRLKKFQQAVEVMMSECDLEIALSLMYDSRFIVPVYCTRKS